MTSSWKSNIFFQGAILERARKINYLLEDGGKETYSFALWSPNLVLNRLCIGHLFTRLATRSSLYGNKKWPINIYIYIYICMYVYIYICYLPAGRSEW